jgi:tetratricopeptide (TPR) repeat protein
MVRPRRPGALASLLLVASVSGAVAATGAAAPQQAADPETAVQAYRELLTRDPGNAQVRSNLGAALAALGRYGEAIEAYRGALEITPGNSLIRMNLALSYYKSADIPRAVEELDALHREAPGDLRTTLLLADCRLRLGEYDAVVDLLRPLEAGDPDNRPVLYLMGMALIRSGKPEEGQLRVERLMRGGNSAEVHYLLGAASFLSKDYPRALDELSKALALNAGLPLLRSHYGRALLFTGDADGAERALREALTGDPNDYDANYYLASILAARRRPEEARPFAERALQLRPGSEEARKLLVGPEPSAEAPPPMDASGYTDLRQDGYPIRSRVRVVPPSRTKLVDTDLVIGVVVEGQARAYPVNLMFGPSNEALNDVLAGVPVAATWCPVAHSAVVFERTVRGRVVDLGALGLEQGVFKLYDRETRSTWSQVSGIASGGPLRGQALRKRESMLTTWGEWLRLHPQTTVYFDPALPDRHAYNKDVIARITRAAEGPLRNEDLVVGVEGTTPPRAWLLRKLGASRVLNDVAGNDPVVVFLAEDGVTVRVMRRRVDGRVLTFAAEGDRLRDTETGSRWDGLTGRAVSGPLEDRRLETLVATTALWYAWRSQRPETTIWEGR